MNNINIEKMKNLLNLLENEVDDKDLVVVSKLKKASERLINNKIDSLNIVRFNNIQMGIEKMSSEYGLI